MLVKVKLRGREITYSDRALVLINNVSQQLDLKPQNIKVAGRDITCHFDKPTK